MVTFLPTKRAVLFLFSLEVSFDWANLPSHTMDIKQLINAFVNKLCKRGSLAFSTIQKSAFHCQILPVFSAARETTLINVCLPSSSSSYLPFLGGSYSSSLWNLYRSRSYPYCWRWFLLPIDKSRWRQITR